MSRDRNMEQTTLADLRREVLMQLYFHTRRKLLYCPVYKASTSTWLNNFIRMEDTKSEVKPFANQFASHLVLLSTNILYV